MALPSRQVPAQGDEGIRKDYAQNVGAPLNLRAIASGASGDFAYVIGGWGGASDLEQEEHIRIVKAVARMRRIDRYAMLLFALLTMLGLGGFSVWGKEDGDLLFGMLLGLTLIFTVAYIKFVKLACPGCGIELTPPGKFSSGTLNEPRCAGCGVSFEMDRQ